MTKRIVLIVAGVLIALLLVAPAAFAVSSSVIDDITNDAADGTIDGNWTDAQIQAALTWLRNSSLANQYGDLEDILEGYLAGGGVPSAGSGDLSFTGADLWLSFSAGCALLGGGLLAEASHGLTAGRPSSGRFTHDPSRGRPGARRRSRRPTQLFVATSCALRRRQA